MSSNVSAAPAGTDLLGHAHPPDGDSSPSKKGGLSSYSDRLKMNVRKSERLSRKILEITLEVDNNTTVNVEKKDAAKVASRIGIDLVNDLEGFQICPGNSKKILFWLKEGLNIDRFCKDEVFKVSNGIRTGFIRPMDRREVTVTIKGLNFNTPDSLVIEYLNKHGKVTNPKVIYDVDKTGPFKGVRNGDRKYQCDFSEGVNLGSYHIIDGHKVFIFYPGQRKTCGRCYQIANNCPGGAIAKLCDEKKGPKVKLTDHMIAYWKSIGFKPSSFKLEEDIDHLTDDVQIHANQNFTPPAKKFDPTDEEKALYTGVIIKNIPEAFPKKDIADLLAEAGVVDADEKIHITINNNKATAEVTNLTSMDCNNVIEKLNQTKISENTIFCRGLSDLSSPLKSKDVNVTDNVVDIAETADISDEKVKSPAKPLPLVIVPGLVQTPLTLNQQKKLKRKQNKALKDASNELNEDDFDFNDDVDNASNPGGSVNALMEKFGGPGNLGIKRKSSPQSHEVEKRSNFRS